MNPLVSFIIAAYNAEEFIVECVESCLNQTYQPIEVVVTDDGSSDNTTVLLQKTYSLDPRVKLFKFSENKGKVAAFNHSYLNSNGKYIAIIGADDVNIGTRIEEQLKYMDKYDLVYCDLCSVNENRSKIIQHNVLGNNSGVNREIDFDEMILAPPTVGSIFMKRDLAGQIFPMPEKLSHEDWWIPLIASFFKNILFLNKVLYVYRIHDNNTSGLFTNYANEKDKLLKLEIRHLSYYQNVLEFLKIHNCVKFYQFIEMKICFLEWYKEKIILDTNPDLHNFKKKLEGIKLSLPDNDVPVFRWNHELLKELKRCLNFKLWKEGKLILQKLSLDKNSLWLDYKMCLLFRITDLESLRSSGFYRPISFLYSLNRYLKLHFPL
jgi:glycosyltransferase involved in cell wall biosynthesis